MVRTFQRRSKAARKKQKRKDLLAFQSDRRNNSRGEKGRSGGGGREYGDRSGKDKKRFAGKAKKKTEFWTDEEMKKRITESNVIKNSDYTPAQLKRRAQARRDDRLYSDVPELFNKDKLNGKWACVECRKFGHTVANCNRTNRDRVSAGSAVPQRIERCLNQGGNLTAPQRP